MSTKIHAVVDALGNPLRFILTPGQVSDITQAEELIAGLPPDHVLADKRYDSKALRETIVKQDAAPVIPPRKTSPQVPCDLYPSGVGCLPGFWLPGQSSDNVT